MTRFCFKPLMANNLKMPLEGARMVLRDKYIIRMFHTNDWVETVPQTKVNRDNLQPGARYSPT